MPEGITAMRRVSAYKTTDGTVHEDRASAVRNQARIDLIDLICDATGQDRATAADVADGLIGNVAAATQALRASQKGI